MKKLIKYIAVICVIAISNAHAVEDKILLIENSILRSLYSQGNAISNVKEIKKNRPNYDSLSKDLFSYWYQSRYLNGIKSEKIDSFSRSLYQQFSKNRYKKNQSFKELIANDPLIIKGLSTHYISSGDKRIPLYSETIDEKFLISSKEKYMKLVAEFNKFLNK